MLDKYSPEQLKVIIQNLAPSGLLEWAEELDRDLTDPSIRMRYRNHMDGLADFFWRHQYMSEIFISLKKKYDKETVIEKMMGGFNLTHYEAKLLADWYWDI